MSVQEVFLEQVRRRQIPVTMFLMNGFQLRGIVRGFDTFVVALQTDEKQQIIYKHAISTIIPEQTVPVGDTANACGIT